MKIDIEWSLFGVLNGWRVRNIKTNEQWFVISVLFVPIVCGKCF
jgi:hypothetical protein